jgi:hypothetical protein
MTIWSTEASSSIAVVQIVSLEAKLVVPPTAELVADRRISSSRPCGQRRPLGEPPHYPDQARVYAMISMAGGRRWPLTVDVDLIRRSQVLHTGSAARAR